MDPILHLLHTDDLCSVILLIGILVVLGQNMVATEPALRSWGLRLAAVAFVAFCIYAYLRLRPADGQGLLHVSARALLAAGLTLGVAWILLPIVAFVYRSLFSSLEKARRAASAARRSAEERRARQQEEERQRRADEEYRRGAPERERAAKEYAAAQKRRSDARARCELFFALHAPEIGERFPKAMFNDYLARHMEDGHSPEHVEERAQQLLELLQRHLDKIEPPRKALTVEELAAWYTKMKDEIEKQAVDDKQKRVQLAQLNLRYRDLMNEVLENLQP